jgi:hypothetical protein
VSKRRRKRPAPDKRELPLVSPNWWNGTKAVLYVRASMGGSNIADGDLRAAIERGDVRAKIEQVRRNYNPPARRSELLKPDFFQREFKLVQHFGAPLALMSRTDQNLLGQWEIYYWGPDVEKIWPTGTVATTASSPIDGGAARRRPGPKVTAGWRLVYAAAAHEFRGKYGRVPSATELAQLCAGRLHYQPDEATIRKLLQYLVGE